MGGTISALVEMRAICHLLSIRTAALKVSFIIVVVHHQPFRAVTLIGGLVEDVAILTITLSSNLVKPGTRRAVGRGWWPGCVRGVPGCVFGGSGCLGSVSGCCGCLGSIGGCCGSVGGCLVRALIEMRSIVQIVSVRAGTFKVSFLVVVSHFQPIGAVTLVGCPVNHVTVLTVTFLSILVQCGSSRALVRHIGCRVGGCLGRVGGCCGRVGGCRGSVGGCCGSVGGCLVRALIEMRSIVQIVSVRAGTFKVSFLVVVSHFQPIGAVTLVGCPVNHIAVLTVTFLSILVQCGASRALVRHIGCRVGGCLGRVGGCRGRVGGCCGSVGGCRGSSGWRITGVGALVEMKTVVQILSVRAGTFKVSFLVVVSHFQPIGAVTLVGCPVNHVTVLTVTFLSILVQCGASWAVVIRRGRRDSNRVLQQEQDNKTQVNPTSDYIQTYTHTHTHTHTKCARTYSKHLLLYAHSTYIGLQ